MSTQAGKTRKAGPAPKPKQEPKGTGKAKNADKIAQKQKAAAELAAELKQLRETLKELVAQVEQRIDGRIGDALRILEAKPAQGDGKGLPGAKKSLQQVKKLQGLHIQTNRGRLKDIASIKQLAEKIAGKIPGTSC